MTKQEVSVERVIAAPAGKIFDVLASPAGHASIDGSGSIVDAKDGDQRLELGSKFGMKMKIGLPYPITNKVVEFEENRLIAWQHFGRHRWRFELEPQDDGSTLVRQTFDWSTAVVPKLLEWLGYPKKHPEVMAKTLKRLEEVVTGEPRG